MANIRNAIRQLTNAMTSTTNNGAEAPPQRAPIHINACERVRSRMGSHKLRALVRFGKQPASPPPNRNRMTIMEAKFHAHPVAAVKNDHHNTTRISTLRGPILSPSQPVGISNNA